MKPVTRIVILFAALLIGVNVNGQISPDMKVILDEVVHHAKLNALNTRTVKWDSIQSEMYLLAQQAKNINDLKASFEFLLVALSDRSGKFTDPTTGTLIASYPASESPEQASGAMTVANDQFTFTLLHHHVAYLKITGVTSEADIQKEASAIRTAIDSLSKEDGIQWIVDLRSCSTGNVNAMIAGMGPLLGEGLIGGIVDGKNKIKKLYEIHNGRFYDDQQLVLSFPCSKDLRPSKVAVLIGNQTSGAGEVLAIALKGRKNTKFFGEATAGNIGITQSVEIRKKVVMSLSTSLYQDRRGNVTKLR